MSEHVRRRDGEPKVAFVALDDARQWLARRRRNYEGDRYQELVPYRCSECHHWHVGTPRTSIQDRRSRAQQNWRAQRETMILELGQRAVVDIEAENARGRHDRRRFANGYARSAYALSPTLGRPRTRRRHRRPDTPTGSHRSSDLEAGQRHTRTRC